MARTGPSDVPALTGNAVEAGQEYPALPTMVPILFPALVGDRSSVVGCRGGLRICANSPVWTESLRCLPWICRRLGWTGMPTNYTLHVVCAQPHEEAAELSASGRWVVACKGFNRIDFHGTILSCITDSGNLSSRDQRTYRRLCPLRASSSRGSQVNVASTWWASSMSLMVMPSTSLDLSLTVRLL